MHLKTKKEDAKIKEYINAEEFNKCLNKDKCTTARNGKIVRKDKFSAAVDNMKNRIEQDKNKYSQRKCIVEHTFGTIKEQ